MASELMFYTYPSCTSCRKTKAFLQEQELQVSERHIFRDAPVFCNTNVHNNATKSTELCQLGFSVSTTHA